MFKCRKWVVLDSSTTEHWLFYYNTLPMNLFVHATHRGAYITTSVTVLLKSFQVLTNMSTSRCNNDTLLSVMHGRVIWGKSPGSSQRRANKRCQQKGQPCLHHEKVLLQNTTVTLNEVVNKEKRPMFGCELAGWWKTVGDLKRMCHERDTNGWCRVHG